MWVSLKGHEHTAETGRSRWTLRDLLVVAQVCFCMVLMVVSSMFSQAVLSIFATEPGFETQHVLAVPVDLSPERYSAPDAQAFLTRLQDRIAAVGQVESVATSSMKRWNTMPVLRRWRAMSLSISGCSASPTLR